jgi:hypothetical protein
MDRKILTDYVNLCKYYDINTLYCMYNDVNTKSEVEMLNIYNIGQDEVNSLKIISNNGTKFETLYDIYNDYHYMVGGKGKGKKGRKGKKSKSKKKKQKKQKKQKKDKKHKKDKSDDGEIEPGKRTQTEETYNDKNIEKKKKKYKLKGTPKVPNQIILSAAPPIIQSPYQQPMIQQPIIQSPYQQPMIQQPMIQQPMIQQPMIQQPMIQQPMCQCPCSPNVIPRQPYYSL